MGGVWGCGGGVKQRNGGRGSGEEDGDGGDVGVGGEGRQGKGGRVWWGVVGGVLLTNAVCSSMIVC
jgi:hypothetical protein